MLIIPKQPRWRGWGSPPPEYTQLQADVKCFEKYLEEYLDKAFNGWRNCIEYDLTEKFLVFDRKKTGWKTDRICRLPREKAFVLSDKQKKAITDWIIQSQQLKENERIREQQKVEKEIELQRLINLSRLVADSFTNEKYSVMGGDSILVETLNHSASVRIRRNGEIDAPEFDWNTDSGSIRQLQNLIDSFQGLNLELFNFAVKIKKELPKEWFENGEKETNE